ncbi:hypothetical protein [Streptomyces sp. NPDC056061]|uniref:hypothetical protein n=1 Tax=Streptomyces sp. NPDC056061 TaxID=3345700 RepID=UPI0035DA1D44
MSNADSRSLRFGKQMADGPLERCRAAGAAIRARVGPVVDTALATVDVAATVYTIRRAFARHVLAEARRHLLETLRGRAFVPGLDDYITDEALSRHSRRLTVPRKGRRAPAPDQLTYTADFTWPHRWWIASTDGKTPQESSRYERARVASLALQNAIRTTRSAHAARDDAPAATTSDMPHAVDHPGQDASLTPAQRAVAIQAHQQAAMPQEYLEGRTTDPATWIRTPENLERLAALTHAANARRRAIEDREDPAADPASLVDRRRQEHEQQRQ